MADAAHKRDDLLWDMLIEERDAWRYRALGVPVPPCRHVDPPTAHQADLPGGTVIDRTADEVRSKNVAAEQPVNRLLLKIGEEP